MFWQTVIADALGGTLTAVVVAVFGRYGSAVGEYPSRRRLIRVFTVAFVALVISDLTPIPLGETFRVAIFGPPSQNERWTLDAWRAFERRDYLGAIAAADQVVNEYSGVANRQQLELEKGTEPRPPVGKVAPWAAGEIFARGVGNDVAACYWILGRSYEQIGKSDQATTAYTKASRLTYARVWDPQWWPLRGWSPFGWFWSPAEVASDRVPSELRP